MPSFDIIRKSNPKKTFRVASVMGTYDLQTSAIEERFCGNIDLPDRWQIGLIVGASGTGKTTIARELFPKAYIERFEYTHESLLDDMPENRSMSEITRTFTNVGFASVPSWLKSYAVLSNGEKMRCDLARAILSDEDLFVFDEFTSVVDRNIAKIGSFAMQKAIRKTSKQFIAVTCHYDVEDWLLPDWVFDTDSMTFRVCEGQKKNRPKFELRIYETKRKDYYWRVFSKHHYLSHSFNKAARMYIATLNGQICGMTSDMHFFSRTKNLRRIHRTVILPDFQGLGLSIFLQEFVCRLNKKQNKRTSITTSHPAMIEICKHSNKWKCTHFGRMSRGSENGIIHNKHKRGSTSCARITASFEYIGN